MCTYLNEVAFSLSARPAEIGPSHSCRHYQFWPVLQRLCHMRGLDLVAPCEIYNRAREFQDAMIGMR